MNKIKVLIPGYAKKIDEGWLASSTVTLVESNGKKIIVDPGCNRKKLLQEFSKLHLRPSDIDFVYCTHNHTDHILLTGMFENAKVLNEREIYDDDKQVAHHGKVPGTDLKIILTPGHDQFHSALIVSIGAKTYVVAGDVFWWMDNEEQKTDKENLLNHEDPYVKDEKAIRESREKILKIADYIIPGHGKMFEGE